MTSPKTEISSESSTEVRKFLVADLFCGAGGSSTGAQRAITKMGGTMELVAVNHWSIAIETHQLNHPNARHYVHDLESADPETLVPEGRLDLLMASPECRFFSRARGGKPIHDQGRMNPWAVQRWLTAINIRCVLIENVPEFIRWGPLDDEGKPIKKRAGEYFEAWVRALRSLGYDLEWQFINAADYGEATSRKRFFLQARNDGNPIVWPEPHPLPEWTGRPLRQAPQMARSQRNHRLEQQRTLVARRPQVRPEPTKHKHQAQNRPRTPEIRWPTRLPVHQAP